MENIFYANGSKFHKEQEINIIRNFILFLRYLIKNGFINVNENFIINEIKNILCSLIKGPKEDEIIMNNYQNMYYIDKLEKLFFYLSILFNYDEIKQIFKYIINLFLPYFSFGFYLRYLISKNNFYSLYDQHLKDQIDINNLISYLINNNQQMLDSFHFFLQKLLIIKLITNYDKNNEEIINSFNELSIEQLLSILNMENLYKELTYNKNNINFIDIFNDLPKLFKNDETFYKEYGINFDYKKIFELLIYNLKENKDEKYIIKSEFIIQLIPIKFQFIQIDNNIHDWIEKNIDKKCSVCLKFSIFCIICLICGEKLCHIDGCNKVCDHTRDCGGSYCVYIDMDNMKLYIYDYLKRNGEISYPLYVDEEGIGPDFRVFGNNFNLNKEKIKITLKNFVCNDI